MNEREAMDLKESIAAESARISKVMRDDMAHLSTKIDPLLTEILDYGLFGGGKRVRPLLCVLSSRLAGREDQQMYHLACAFEYLHVASLFHDDVLDSAEKRRGRASVNNRFGMNGAILTGDFLLAHSMAIIGDYTGTEGLNIFTEATRKMVDGEFIQIRNKDDFNQSEADYFSVVMGKTAMLIGAACEIGALFGGADQQKQKALKSYGINLGSAFQIIDDLLDYQGDEDLTGKTVGNDLAEGKMTLPLIFTLETASEQDRERLFSILREERNSSSSFPEVLSIMQRYDGFDRAQKKAESIIEDALKPLTLFTDESQQDTIRLLIELSHYVLSRQK